MSLYIGGQRIKPFRLVVIILGIISILYIIKHLLSTDSNSLQYKVNNVDDINNFIQHSNEHDNMDSTDDLPELSDNEDIKLDSSIDDITPEFLKKLDKKTKKCIDYVDYSQERHPPFSKGKHKYPFMRPAPKCRTFKSDAVEYLIQDLKKKIEDPDLSRLIENCLPNTLDTTILWHVSTLNKKDNVDIAQSFVVTGDIHAEWLRDSARQLSVYQPFLKYDENLKELIKGAINTQAYYLISSPYCNAFHPPPDSGVKRGNTAMDQVFPRPDWKHVFECKYELDSLASFLTLSNEYYTNSGGDTSFVSKLWLKAYERLLIVLKRESQPSFDKETGQPLHFYYSFQRQTNIGSETLPLGGVGNPVNFETGLIRSAFRPSDDSCILQFFIPANLHMLTELKKVSKNLFNGDTKIWSSMIETTNDFIKNIEFGIDKFGIVDHPIWGKVYAYEVDGYGSSIFMDDANLPSLLSLPDMGYLDTNDEVYQNTRKMILSKNGNPYYLTGLHFEGIGGPHIGIHNAWPMSLLVKIRTTDNDDEILKSLKFIMDNTANLGLMHESVQINSRNGNDYTRPWFAWCNSEFGKTILYLAKNKPHLIFKEEFANVGYDLDSVFQNFKVDP